MGDAFKGLTIRLGGDARPLNSAIESVKSHAGEAQRSINRLTRALKFNPSDTKAMASRLSLVEDKAQLAARQVRLMDNALKQAEKHAGKFAVKGDLLGSGMKNAYAEAQRLRSAYNGFNMQLQTVYDSLKRIAASHFGVSFKDADKFVKELQADLGGTGDKAKQAAADIKRLMEIGYDKGSFKVPFDLKNSQEAISALMRLREEQAKVSKELEGAKAAKGVKAARVQASAAAVELRQATAEAAKFKAELYAAGHAHGGWDKQLSDIQRLDDVLKRAQASSQRMGEAYNVAPKSMEAAVAKMRAMEAEEDSLRQKASALAATLRKIEETPGFDKMSAATHNVIGDVSRLTAKLGEENAELKKLEESATLLKQKMANLDASSNGAYRRSSKYREEKKELDNLNKSIDAHRRKMAGTDSALQTASEQAQWRKVHDELVEVNAQVDKYSNKRMKSPMWGNIGALIKNLGYAAYSTITPMLTIAGRYAIDAANDIDSAYRDMRKTVNGSEEDFEHLKDAAVEFSRTHVTTADTMLEIEAMGGQLGIAVENLEGFGHVVSNLDIATDMDAETIAKNIGQLSNIMDDFDQSKPEEYQRQITSFSDSLVRLGNNSAAQESAIMNVMMRIASLGNISGFTTPQLLSIADAVAATGQGSEAAGTAISKTFSNIESAVGTGEEALKNYKKAVDSGNKAEAKVWKAKAAQLEKFADVSGMSAEKFAKSWNKTPMEAFTAFIGGLKRIDEEGGSVDNTLKDLGIGSVRQKQALEGLTTTYDVMTQAIGMAQDAWDGASTTLANGKIEEAGDAAREAERKSEGFSGQLQMMKNNATAMAVELSNGATPIITGLGDAFKGVGDFVHELPDGMKTAAVGAGVAAASFGPVAVALGSVLTAGSNIKQTFANIPAAWNRLVGMSTKPVSVMSNLLLEVADLAGMSDSTFDRMAVGTQKVDKGLTKLKSGFSSVGRAVGSSLAIGGVIAIAGVAIDGLTKYFDHLKKAESITKTTFDRMSESLHSASSKVTLAASGLQHSAKSIGQIKHERYEWIEELADSLDEVKKKQTETFSNNALIDHYADSIEKLMKKANTRKLSWEEQGELRSAVEGFNSATGESIELIDAESAKLADSSGNVLKNADAFKQLAEAKMISSKAEVFQEEYNKTYKALYEGKQQYEDARAAYDEAQANASKLLAIDPDKTQTETQVAVAAAEEAKAVMEEIAETNRSLETSAEQAKGELEIMQRAMDDSATASDRLIADHDELRLKMYGSGQSVSDFAMVLHSLGKETKGMSDGQLVTLANAWDGTLKSIMPLLDKYGMSVDKINQKKIGNQSFYVTDNGTIYTLEGELAGFEKIKIGDKTWYLNDDGTLSDSKLRLTDFEEMQVGPKTYYVSDGGTVMDQTGQLDNLRSIAVDDKTYIVSDDGSVFDETGKIGDLNATDIADKFVHIDTNAKDAEATVNATSDAIRKLPKQNQVRFDTNRSQVIGDISMIQSAINNIKGKTVYVNVVQSNGKGKGGGGSGLRGDTGIGFAKGGIDTNLLRSIPRHASGTVMNGIATRATLTNIGWVGEDGDEALLRMGSRSAVVPLSNRRYVRPFARAVASEMGAAAGGSQTVVHNHYTVAGVTYDDGSNVAAAVETLVNYGLVASRRK